MNTKDFQQQEFINTISLERLSSYSTTPGDNFNLALKEYIYNIKISEAFYPILAVLEIALRNRIFHHEIITNHKLGIQNCYNITKNLLTHISKDCSSLLTDTCHFNDIIKQKS